MKAKFDALHTEQPKNKVVFWDVGQSAFNTLPSTLCHGSSHTDFTTFISVRFKIQSHKLCLQVKNQFWDHDFGWFNHIELLLGEG
jgi:hypothetical protein